MTCKLVIEPTEVLCEGNVTHSGSQAEQRKVMINKSSQWLAVPSWMTIGDSLKCIGSNNHNYTTITAWGYLQGLGWLVSVG